MQRIQVVSVRLHYFLICLDYDSELLTHIPAIHLNSACYTPNQLTQPHVYLAHGVARPIFVAARCAATPRRTGAVIRL